MALHKKKLPHSKQYNTYNKNVRFVKKVFQLVSIPHTYTQNYSFRSQKTSLFQKEEGLFILQHGASRDVINSGRTLGFSTSPREIDAHKNRLLREQPSFIQLQISNSIKVSKVNTFLCRNSLCPTIRSVYIKDGRVTKELIFSWCI